MRAESNTHVGRSAKNRQSCRFRRSTAALMFDSSPICSAAGVEPALQISAVLHTAIRQYDARRATDEGITMSKRCCCVFAGALLLTATSPTFAQAPALPVTV